MVATRFTIVTFSRSISARHSAGAKFISTFFSPKIAAPSVHANPTRPNIGNTVMTTSRRDRSMPSMKAPIELLLNCVSTYALGSPVVPDVRLK